MGGICDADPTGICDVVEDTVSTAVELMGDLVSSKGAFAQAALLTELIARDKATSLVFRLTLDLLTAGFSSTVLDVINEARVIVEQIPIPVDLQVLTKGNVFLGLYNGGPGSWVRSFISPYVDGLTSRMELLGAANVGSEYITQAGTLNATNDAIGRIITHMGYPLFDRAMNDPQVRSYDPAKKWSYDGNVTAAYENFQIALNDAPFMKLSPTELAVALGLSRVDCALEAKALVSGRPEDLRAWLGFIRTDFVYGRVRTYYDAESGTLKEDPPKADPTLLLLGSTLAPMSSAALTNIFAPADFAIPSHLPVNPDMFERPGDDDGPGLGTALVLTGAAAGAAWYGWRWWQRRRRSRR